MPRFQWNNPKAGRRINEYIDYICEEFPSIAKGVVKHGIGDLDSWFGSGAYADTATCGCLVGTTALVAMTKMPKLAKKVNLHLGDGAVALYRLIVEKTKRDVEKYDDVAYYSSYSYDENDNNIDPLFKKIARAGVDASEEAEEIPGYQSSINDDDWDRYEKELDIRRKMVKDHIEERIRRKLNIPHPRVKNAGHFRAD